MSMKNKFFIPVLAVLLAQQPSLSMDSALTTPKKITGEFVLTGDGSSGYCGATANIASSSLVGFQPIGIECIAIETRINKKLSQQELEQEYNSIKLNMPHAINNVIDKGLDPEVFFKSLMSKSAIPGIFFIPAHILSKQNLSYGKIVKFTSSDGTVVELAYKGTSEDIQSRRRAFKDAPAVFLVGKDSDIFALVRNRVITVDPVTGAIGHGIYGPGPKEEMQNESQLSLR